ncbi:MAG TPA: DUF5693 family protein [Candidatus Atribacteria bacterium]|nr:DUF5693 family protein [Candidatus Atribacteria bacterium]
MRRNIFLLIGFLIVFFFSLPIIRERWERESQSRIVELVVDWNDIEWIGKTEGVDPLLIAEELKKEGFETLGVSELTWRQLVSQGRAVPVVPSPFSSPLLRYFQISDPLLRETVKNHLLLLGKEVEEKGEILGVNILYEEEDKIGVGWDYRVLQALQEQGFRILLRPYNRYNIPPSVLENLLQEKAWEVAKGVIFSGDSVLGAPRGDSLRLLSSFLQEKGLFWGYLEFVGQKGETTLASFASPFTLRAHSIPPEELKGYTPQEARDRFLRAVKERSVPILYLRLFTDPPAYGSWEKNFSYLLSIKRALIDNEYIVGEVSVPSPSFSPPLYSLLFFALALSFFVFCLWSSFFRPSLWIIPLCFIPLGGLIFYNTLWGMRVLGFLAGLVYPTLAAIIMIDAFSTGKGKFKSLGWAFMTLFSGALTVSAGLYHWLFLLRIYQYWGVKASLLVPPLLVLLYLFRKSYWGLSIRQVLLEDLKRFELLVVAFLGVAALLYLTRSGNFPILPAGGLETKIRIALEHLLFMRPRTKEFLIGYPALWLLFYWDKDKIRPAYSLILWLGVAVGFTTFFNSFCHIHTPFLYILLRFLNALVLSIPVAIVYIIVIKLALFLWQRVGKWGEKSYSPEN